MHHTSQSLQPTSNSLIGLGGLLKNAAQLGRLAAHLVCELARPLLRESVAMALVQALKSAQEVAHQKISDKGLRISRSLCWQQTHVTCLLLVVQHSLGGAQAMDAVVGSSKVGLVSGLGDSAPQTCGSGC
jgi:hypothetical protein